MMCRALPLAAHVDAALAGDGVFFHRQMLTLCFSASAYKDPISVLVSARPTLKRTLSSMIAPSTGQYAAE